MNKTAGLVSVLSLCALMFLGSCASIRDKQIVGRWQEVSSPAIGVFHEDGTVELTTGQSQFSGTYSFIAPAKLKIELMGNDAKPVRPHVYDVAISGDKMTWKDVDGTTAEYRRSK